MLSRRLAWAVLLAALLALQAHATAGVPTLLKWDLRLPGLSVRLAEECITSTVTTLLRFCLAHTLHAKDSMAEHVCKTEPARLQEPCARAVLHESCPSS